MNLLIRGCAVSTRPSLQGSQHIVAAEGLHVHVAGLTVLSILVDGETVLPRFRLNRLQPNLLSRFLGLYGLQRLYAVLTRRRVRSLVAPKPLASPVQWLVPQKTPNTMPRPLQKANFHFPLALSPLLFVHTWNSFDCIRYTLCPRTYT
jgi:hypothetical protein